MNKRNTIFIILLLVVQCVVAQQVSQAEALKHAKAFFGASSKKTLRKAVSSPFELAYTAEQDGKIHYYVFNNSSLGEQGGFVIVGGDEAVRTILGYSTGGVFSYDRLPENVRWWLSQYDQQIAYGIRQGVQASTSKVSHTGWVTVPDLLTTKWNQGTPFNSEIPSPGLSYTGNDALATGCTATAVAQVMKYYEWPKRGKGSHTDYYTYKGIAFSADFGATIYDWNNMPDRYFDGYYSNSTPLYNEAQAKAVGTLMYHVGVASDMDYGQIGAGGSAASEYTAGVALINYFDYDKGMSYRTREYYTDEAWEQMVYDELKSGRPIIYAGSSENGGGHVFVCHGYDADKDLFAFNWGWGGHYDGYFPLTGTGALQPKGSGIGGAGDNKAYVLSQRAIFNLMPNHGGDYEKRLQCSLLRNQTDYALATSDVVETFTDDEGEWFCITDAVSSYMLNRSTFSDVTLYMFSSPRNASLTDIPSFDLGVRLTGKNTGDTYYVKARYALGPLPPRYRYRNLKTAFSTSILEKADTYVVEPVYRFSADDDWQLLPYTPAMTVPVVIISDGSIEGDVNGDSLVNIILRGADTAPSVADVNGDGSVNISDVTTLVNIILHSGTSK